MLQIGCLILLPLPNPHQHHSGYRSWPMIDLRTHQERYRKWAVTCGILAHSTFDCTEYAGKEAAYACLRLGLACHPETMGAIREAAWQIASGYFLERGGIEHQQKASTIC